MYALYDYNYDKYYPEITSDDTSRFADHTHIDTFRIPRQLPHGFILMVQTAIGNIYLGGIQTNRRIKTMG